MSGELFPEVGSLRDVLREMLQCPELVIIRRHARLCTSTHLNEVVTLRLPAGRQRALIKYGGSECNQVYGHRGGVPYEAAVYREILPQVNLPLAVFHGAHR